MAKIRPIHGEMSGSIGGNTWSHNKGGQYVRQRTTPTNPNSVRQQKARSYLSTLTHGWGALTAAQRNAWTAWATANPVVDTLGQTFVRSGQQAYIALNARLLDQSLTASSAPPISSAPNAPTSVTISSNSATTLLVAFTPTPLGTGIKLVSWITPPGSAGRNPNFKQARLCGYSAANAATGITVTTPFALAAGQVINAYFQCTDATGQVSPPIKVTYTCS